MWEFALPPLTFSPKLVCTPFTEMHDKSLLLLRGRPCSYHQLRKEGPPSLLLLLRTHQPLFFKKTLFSTKPHAHLFPSIPKKTQLGSFFSPTPRVEITISVARNTAEFLWKYVAPPQRTGREISLLLLCPGCSAASSSSSAAAVGEIKVGILQEEEEEGAPSQKKKEGGRWVGMFPPLPSPLPGWRRRRRRRRWAYVHTC